MSHYNGILAEWSKALHSSSYLVSGTEVCSQETGVSSSLTDIIILLPVFWLGGGGRCAELWESHIGKILGGGGYLGSDELFQLEGENLTYHHSPAFYMFRSGSTTITKI